jgi:arylsulfatase A-like enzyme
MRRNHVRLALGASVVAAVVAGLSYAAYTAATRVNAPQAERPPNILLISIDTLRADHLSSYGYKRPTSPSIDRLAARGVLFEHAYSHSPKTALSHMSLMTSLLPEAHGVEQWSTEGSERLSDDIPTLATLLKPHGYATFAVTGGGHVRGELGFDQGMDSFEVVDGVVEAFARMGDRIAEHVAAQPNVPFFAFAHTYAVHDPYTPLAPYNTLFTDSNYPGRIIASYDELTRRVGTAWDSQHALFWQQVDADDPRDVQHLQDLYDGAIRLTDDQIGKLVERLRDAGVGDDTLIIVLADHGEEFREHGMFQHEQVYQELLHVPLVMVLPRANGVTYRQRREPAVVRLVDVLPTVLDYLGVAIPEHAQGVSLMPLLGGGAAPPREVMSSWREGGWQALRVGDTKLIRRDDQGAGIVHELYVLSEDPHEQQNRWETDGAAGQALEQQLDTLVHAAQEFHAAHRRGRVVLPSADTLERLRALGY